MKKFVCIIFIFCFIQLIHGQNRDTITKSIKQSTDSIIEQFYRRTQVDFKGKYNKEKIDSIQSKHTKQLKDSMVNSLKNTGIDGTTNVSHDYGLLPAFIDSSKTGPISMYSTRGDFVLQTMQIPIKMSYNYSSYQTPYGLNNYFRVGIDFNRLKQIKAEREQQLNIGFDQESLKNKVQVDSLNRKMDYTLVLKNYANTKLEQEKENLVDLESQEALLNDSLKGSNQADSLNLKKQKTIEKIAYYEQMSDSLGHIYDEFESVKDLHQSNEYDLQKQKELLQGKTQQVGQKYVSTYKNQFLSGFTKVNLGLSYPQTTGISNNTVPIKGIDLEHQHKNWYTALSAGLTVNNLLFSNNQLQNNLSNVQNSLNFFDFQNIKKNQFITILKTGYGTKEGSHVFLGIRYLTPISWLEKNKDKQESPSLGLELDTRLKIKRLSNTALDFVIGKTTLNKTDTLTPASSHFFDARTNNALLKIQQRLPRLKTELTASYRWIDPYVDTKNMGLLQADNKRMELQSKHKISNRLSFVFTYRNDRNNLLKQKDSTLMIDLIGTQIQTSIGRVLQIVSSINYIEMGQINRNGQSGPKNQNYLLSCNLSAPYTIKELKGTFSATYSDNYITTQMGNKFFKNIGVQQSTLYKNFSNTLAYNFYSSNSLDTAQNLNNIGIWSNAVSLKLKRMQFRATICYSPDNENNNFGYQLEVNYKISRFVALNTKLEKLIVGDYYNTFYLERYLQFPYTIRTKIIFTLNSNK